MKKAFKTLFTKGTVTTFLFLTLVLLTVSVITFAESACDGDDAQEFDFENYYEGVVILDDPKYFMNIEDEEYIEHFDTDIISFVDASIQDETEADTLKTESMVYKIPQEVLEANPSFAALMEEANKYIGFPYVWGGSTPETSFDCSGFVSYVFTQSGVYNTGRRGATGLYDLAQKIEPQDACPGDLVFFQGTMGKKVNGITHVGIYVGNSMMIHCGNPIGYADLVKPYWQKHLYAYGRLSKEEQP